MFHVLWREAQWLLRPPRRSLPVGRPGLPVRMGRLRVPSEARPSHRREHRPLRAEPRPRRCKGGCDRALVPRRCPPPGAQARALVRLALRPQQGQARPAPLCPLKRCSCRATSPAPSTLASMDFTRRPAWRFGAWRLRCGASPHGGTDRTSPRSRNEKRRTRSRRGPPRRKLPRSRSVGVRASSCWALPSGALPSHRGWRPSRRLFASPGPGRWQQLGLLWKVATQLG
eukprot:s2697_g4.t1